jgi:hypothetical protein
MRFTFKGLVLVYEAGRLLVSRELEDGQLDLLASIPVSPKSVVGMVLSLVGLVVAVVGSLLTDVAITEPKSVMDVLALAVTIIGTLGGSWYAGKLRQIYEMVRELVDRVF